TVNGSGQVVFTMLGSDPTMDVKIVAVTGTVRYLVSLDVFCVANGQVWSDAFCWAQTSGGPGGAGKPSISIDAVMDANSGVGTFPLDENGNVASLNTTGYVGTFAIGTFTFTSAGTVTVKTATITISSGVYVS